MARRILQIIASLQGGAAQHLLLLTQGIRRQGIEVDIAAPDDESGLAQKFKDAGCGFHRLEQIGGFSPGAVLELLSLFRENHYRLIHAHGLRAGAAARTAARLAGRCGDLVFTIHGYHIPYYSNVIARYAGSILERIQSRWVARIICVSKSDCAAYLRTCGPNVAKRVIIIRNGINADNFQAEITRGEARENLGLPPNGFVVGTAARLRPQKDVATLLKAFALFRVKHPGVRLLIAGNGPLRKELTTLSEVLGLGDSTRFLGTFDDMPVFYRALDAFCLSSLWEGLPLVVMEAMAAGVPVVATQVAGNIEVISHMEEGLLVPPGDPEALEKALHCLATNPDIASRIATRAGERVRREFGVERMVSETIKVYSELAPELVFPDVSGPFRDNMRLG